MASRVEPLLAARCPCCNLVQADTCQARPCTRMSAQVASHQPLIDTISLVPKRLSVAHTAEDGEFFLADRGLQMDIVVPVGELRDASIPASCHKSLKSAHYARPGQASFGER